MNDAEAPVVVLQVTGVASAGSAEHLRVLIESVARTGDASVHLARATGGTHDRALDGVARSTLAYRLGREGEGVAYTQPMVRPWHLAGAIVDVRRRVRDLGCQVVHTHTSLGGLVGRVACLGLPVRTVHMVHAFASHDEVPAVRRLLLRLGEQALARRTDIFVVGSEHMRRWGARTRVFGSAEVVVIPNAIAPPPAASEEAPGLAVGRSDGPVTIGFVGRLEPQKGVDLLLDAFAAVAARHEHVRLVIIGDGRSRPELEAQAARLPAGAGAVSFLGWVDRASDHMGGFDLLAVPSRWEPFGLVNLEAMAAGVPIVAFAVGGIPEVVDDGTTGLLVAPGDIAAMTEALGRLVADRRARVAMGTAGRQRYGAAFGPEQLGRAHAELYRSLRR